jgi:hypothetical protein
VDLLERIQKFLIKFLGRAIVFVNLFFRGFIGKNSKISNKIFGTDYCFCQFIFPVDLLERIQEFLRKYLGRAIVLSIYFSRGFIGKN